MTMITPSYLGETIEYSSLHACRSTLEDPTDMDHSGGVRILACLCMHTIGYYRDTWAGALCPTDDVIAHLILCRGDERLYWSRCNQHAPGRPEAGL